MCLRLGYYPRGELMAEYCVTCNGVHGSYDPLAACGCDQCPRCNKLVEHDLRRWLGTTVNPKGGAL